MADELSPADRSSLAAEHGPVNMAVGGVLILEKGPGVALDPVIERLESRLHLIPRYRQRLQQPTPGGFTNPVWVDDDGFDAHWHVRRAATESLERFVGVEMSRRLDRSRPLWEMNLVDGFSEGLVALMPKMHHALADGVAAVDVGTVILDPTPEPMDLTPEEPWQPQRYDRRRHLARLAASPMVRAQRLFLEGAERALAATTDPLRGPGDLRKATELVTQLARTRPQAPMTFLNRGIGPNRRYAMARAPLAELKAAGKAAGGTVNDAILAAVGGMLARLFELAGERPSRPPVALVPVSVRRPGEEGGNRISTVLVDLPLASSPAAGIAEVHEAMAALKESAAVRAGALLVGAGGWAPPLVSSGLARAMGGVRAFNLVVSNIPGPQQPFYLNGSQLRAAYPVVPLNPASQGLTVGVLSYDGFVHFGLLADRDLSPSVTDARDALSAALTELTDLDASRNRSPRPET